MTSRAWILGIAVVLVLPIFFALLGGSDSAGLLIGVVLVCVGIATWIWETRRAP